MNAYRIQIVLAATLLCALAGNVLLAPLNVIVSVLGIQEIIRKKSGDIHSKGILRLVMFLACVLLIITFFNLMLSYMDILFALM